MKSEKGSTLIEVLLALALLGIISASFLGATMQTTKSRVTADERSSAKILAESLMDTVKKQPYASSYNGTIIIPGEFAGYTANCTVEDMYNIQKLTIAVQHQGREILTLENHKADRTKEEE
jgi:prepilin-type N-terminal cleavage/methylation domain-containing protein